MKSVALMRASCPLSQKAMALVCGGDWKVRLFPLALPSSSYHHSHQQLPLLSQTCAYSAAWTPHSSLPHPKLQHTEFTAQTSREQGWD